MPGQNPNEYNNSRDASRNDSTDLTDATALNDAMTSLAGVSLPPATKRRGRPKRSVDCSWTFKKKIQK